MSNIYHVNINVHYHALSVAALQWLHKPPKTLKFNECSSNIPIEKALIILLISGVSRWAGRLERVSDVSILAPLNQLETACLFLQLSTREYPTRSD